jgi:hypothetical protein
MSITNSNITTELISDFAGGRLDAPEDQWSMGATGPILRASAEKKAQGRSVAFPKVQATAAVSR